VGTGIVDTGGGVVGEVVGVPPKGGAATSWARYVEYWSVRALAISIPNAPAAVCWERPEFGSDGVSGLREPCVA